MPCDCIAKITAWVAPFNQRPVVAHNTWGKHPKLAIRMKPLDPSKPGLTTDILARFCLMCGSEYAGTTRIAAIDGPLPTGGSNG